MHICKYDDTVLMAESEKELQELIDQLEENSKKCGLDINIQKTNTMVISKTGEKPMINIKIKGVLLKQVHNFLYLGHMIIDDGRCEQEIKRRIGMAKNTFNEMKYMLISKQINRLKMRLIKCYIYPTLLYGSETWTTNKNLEDRINAFEMWVFRRLGRISWKERLTNESVLKRIGMKRELLLDLKIRQNFLAT
jgi:hypothetical protein